MIWTHILVIAIVVSLLTETINRLLQKAGEAYFDEGSYGRLFTYLVGLLVAILRVVAATTACTCLIIVCVKTW